MTPWITAIPTGWRASTVGTECDVADNLREPINESERAKMRGPYPYYGPTKIVDYLDHWRVEGTYALIGEDGDHFLKFSELDMTQLVGGRFNVNNHAHLLRGRDGCMTEWLYEYFRRRSLRPFLTRQGTGRYKLTKASLEQLPILVPPLAEQKRIHEVLLLWDGAIAGTDRLVAAKQARRKWLMQQLLTGERRFPGFGEPWRRFRIGALLTEVRRPIRFSDEHTYRLISVRRRSEGLFLRGELRGGQIKTKKMNVARRGDFLISRMQVVHGASGLVTSEFDGMHVSDSYIALRARDPNTFEIRFFDWLSKTPVLYWAALVSSYGVHIEKMTFNLRDYLNHRILIPPTRSEQERIVEILELATAEIGALQKLQDCLREQKKGLMQQLLTGKRRVKCEA